MTRKAIIIGAPGDPKKPKYLSGVEVDVENYTNFLMSPSGGAWQDGDIILIINPTLGELNEAIQDIDYVLIIFSGHGAWEQSTGRQIIKINNKDQIYLDDLKSNAPKQLFIIDACRGKTQGLSGFDEDVYLIDFPSKLTHAKARRMFKNYLNKCKDGIIVCSSCEIGDTSGDSPDGGFFTLKLLESVNRWVKKNEEQNVLLIKGAIRRAKASMRHSSDQKPTIDFFYQEDEEEPYFPFAIKESIKKLF